MKFTRIITTPLRILLIIIIGLFFSECFLRVYLGFCDMDLMQENSNYEYIAQPNQNRLRYRNHILYNSYSMRSAEINPNAKKILGFGDSVINGGVLSDHSELATTILTDSLSIIEKSPVQFLNIAADGWGPDNCFEYLIEKGDFNSKHFFVFLNSSDVVDTMTFKKIIDINPRYQSKQHPLALIELFQLSKQYLSRKFEKEPSKSWVTNKELVIEATPFNPGIESFNNYTKKNNIKLTFFLHPRKSEFINSQYNHQGIQIINFAKQNNIDLIKGIKYLEKSDYRDIIHLNASGQKKISKAVLEYLLNGEY